MRSDMIARFKHLIIDKLLQVLRIISQFYLVQCALKAILNYFMNDTICQYQWILIS